MTDKQIMIDCVDVSYCPNHYNGWSALHRDTRDMCECGYDRECKPKYFQCSHYVKCLEQKLQAKEQECEKLETARHLIEISRDNWEYRAKSKERECESLNRRLPIISRLEMAFGSYEKAKAIDYKSYIEQIFAELDQLKAENKKFKETLDELFKVQYKLADNNKKLRQCLTEIKEIAENYTKRNYADFKFALKSILQKISEVEDV